MERVFMMGFDAWGESSSREDYLASCRKSPKYAQGKWFVLEQEHELLSSLIVYSLDSENSVFGIGSIATPEQHRRKGYASNLLQSTMEHFQAHSPGATFLLYSDISAGFYERLGFAKLPQQHQLYDHSVCMVSPASAIARLESMEMSTPKYF
jgi:predicted acetyltransferase